MVQYAKMEMIDELKKIWLSGFPKDAEYIELFFQYYFTPKCCAIFRNKEEIETALYYLTAYVTINGKEKPVMYLYAASTLPQYAGKGNTSALVRFLINDALKKDFCGVAAYTLPSTKNIMAKESTYPSVFLQEIQYKVNDAAVAIRQDNLLQLEECEFALFKQLRSKYVDDKPYSIYWKDTELDFIYRDSNDSGNVLMVREEGLSGQICKEYYAVIAKKEEGLLIRETDYPKSDCMRLVCSVADYYNYRGMVKLHAREDEKVNMEDAVKQSSVYMASVSIFGSQEIENRFYFNLLAI